MSIPPDGDPQETKEWLDALDAVHGGESSGSSLPHDFEIDLTQISCERPELRRPIERLLRRYKQAIALHATDSGMLEDIEFSIEWKDALGYNPDHKGIVMPSYIRNKNKEGEYRKQFADDWDSERRM